MVFGERQLIKILLVEDDLDLAAGIGDYLAANHIAVDFAYNATQARERVRATSFDLLVLDINLPDQNGITLCRELKAEWKLSQPIIFLTACGDLDDKLSGFSAGAIDYMVKPFAPAELLARIKAITQNVPATGSGQIAVDDWRLEFAGGLLSRQGKKLQLQASALAIVQKLMLAYPACVSRPDLQAALWGDDLPDSDPLRTHVYELRQALLAAFGQSPISTVRGIGYRFVHTT